MADINSALASLLQGKVWRLEGIPGSFNTEAKFHAGFTISTSVENDEHVWSTNPSDFGITWSQIQTEISRLQAIEDANTHQYPRKLEYPPLSDLADAIYWQEKGNGAKMAAYLAAVEAVKAKYPKP